MSLSPEYIEAFVKGAEKLISIFGCWPTFHDAEVCGARLDRKETFRFSEVEEILLEGFNHQNILAALTLCHGQKIGVTLESIFGLEGHFSCRTVEVWNVATLLE